MHHRQFIARSPRWATIALALTLTAACGDAEEKTNNGANNGVTNNGVTNNGATNNGVTNNGATNNGVTNNGATNNGATNNGAEALEVAGNWDTQFATQELLTDRDWNGSAIVEFSNEDNFAITQNAEDSDFDPSKFNKNIWTEPADGVFYYCTVDFGLDTADAAKNTTNSADDSDPDNAGCGGFSWTKMTLVQ